jgi:ammonium transporter, Amt family
MSYAFATASTSIVSGCVAERINVYSYIAFSFFTFGFIYPVIVAWTWGKGWLHNLGFEDFAGSGIVHVTGGFAGLMGAIVCGPRIGKFTDIRTGVPIETETPTKDNKIQASI